MDVSIVSGTYNRLHSLQRMVESALKSAEDYCLGLQAEIVLVDGGSTDGTIEWCRSHPRVRLIEHGELKGAVKAFNDGAYAALGTYVVLANDDIEFIDDTILKAFLFMQHHPDCGIGCFYQDRERQHLNWEDPSRWYVSVMPAVENGRQIFTWYGQVCMVPKWLGDRVGWWGNYLHTYGGDNELTSQVYELGFKVVPVPGTKISDHELQDGLRAINNFGHGKDPKKSGGHHPDSWAWGKRWQFPDRRDVETGQVTTGPTVRPKPFLESEVAIKQRIIYLPIYEHGWTVQKEQKRGLREALAKVGLVFEFDYVYLYHEIGKAAMLADLMREMKEVYPTIVLTQIHNAEMINAEDILNIKTVYPDSLFINWNGDYWPDNLLSREGLELARAFDLQLGVNRDAIEKQRAAGVNAQYWQIGYEPDGVGCDSNTHCDVVFLASGYSSARQNLVKKLRDLKVDFHLYGTGWPEGWAKGQNMYDFKSACKCYRGAKISIGDSQWPDSGFVSNRIFQALAAGGSVLAHQWFKDMELLGLQDGVNCIIWKEFSDLENKIHYYLEHEEERRKVARAGEQLALNQHSFDKRVEELMAMVGQQEEERYWR